MISSSQRSLSIWDQFHESRISVLREVAYSTQIIWRRLWKTLRGEPLHEMKGTSRGDHTKCQGPPALAAPLTHIQPCNRSTRLTNNLCRQTLDFHSLRVLGIGLLSCTYCEDVSTFVCLWGRYASCACLNLLLLLRTVLLFLPARCASVDGCSVVVLLSGGSSRLLLTTSHTVPLPPHCERRLAYGGARDTKEVENFLFDMEQYFLAANVEDEARKANQVRLDTWALLREAIREQFFPKNVEYNAKRALRKLEHTGSIRDYVKAFSALMLDIRDISEKDKLFTFMEGLKLWG
ncbi:UNVERIFIED_CONTAM: hypothetical protein Sradi_6135900 [Sesamum radiatum]|uniref:Retrotransposon gag domain-containing protein n=1 Tax=Sesamum radiatum TaxID=300843 RepID=A0AAW2KK27_SESRA